MIEIRIKTSNLFLYLVFDNAQYYVLLYSCEVIIINTQFKKGVFELLVLLIVENEDKYGYEMVEEVSKVVDVNEGTIYPILNRLTNENYFETYLKESTEGPPRKYYHLTILGKKRKDELLNEWTRFNKSVSKFIKESGK